MNFLELVKRTSKECGISGEGPASVVGQVGIYAKVVNWVKTAHEVLQSGKSWDFDWASTTQALVDGKESYAPLSDWGLSIKSVVQDGLYLYRNVDGPQSKHWPVFVPWQDFRALRMPGVTGIPGYYSIAPDESIYFHPIPTSGITMVMEFYRNPQVLADNLDVPRMPERYHMAIVWRAVMFHCASEENPTLFASARDNLNALMAQMSGSELPHFSEAEPLA